jgi:GAF domain-containing protein
MSSSPPMFTSPEDQIVALLSRWLARHLGNAELRKQLDALRPHLAAEQAELVDELRAELVTAPAHHRGALEPLVRETIEALALG